MEKIWAILYNSSTLNPILKLQIETKTVTCTKQMFFLLSPCDFKNVKVSLWKISIFVSFCIILFKTLFLITHKLNIKFLVFIQTFPKNDFKFWSNSGISQKHFVVPHYGLILNHLHRRATTLSPLFFHFTLLNAFRFLRPFSHIPCCTLQVNQRREERTTSEDDDLFNGPSKRPTVVNTLLVCLADEIS